MLMDDAPFKGRRKLSNWGTVYALMSSLAGLSTVLVIWPGSDSDVTWLKSMSDELRFLVIAAIGGVLGSSLRASALIGSNGDDEKDELPDGLNLLMRSLIAMQMAALVYLAIRSFILLPSTRLTQFNPFGVLALGLLIGTVAEGWIPTIAKRALSGVSPELDNRIHQIASAVGAVVLDNYLGRVRAEILKDGFPLPGGADGKLLKLDPNQLYTLLVWFDPAPGVEGIGETIAISGGNDTNSISFTVAADSSAVIGFSPGRQICTFDPRQKSARLAFEFAAPVMDIPFTFWLRVSQKDRLSAVLAIQAIALSSD